MGKLDITRRVGRRLLPVGLLIIIASMASACAAAPAPAGTSAPASSVQVPTAAPPGATVTPLGAAGPTPSATPPSSGFGHIFVLLMENKEYGDIIGSSKAPYINSLAQSYGSAAQYYAIRHPSLPNYLALASGSTQGMTSDCPDCSFNAPNLVDQLEAHNKSWKAYMEDMPSPCFNGESSGGIGPFGNLYVRRHNPWMYFQDISGNPARCNLVVPLSEFAGDLQANSLADFVWITPNLQHDMHDGSIEDGDKWLSGFVPQILNSPAWKDNGVLFILWDEGTTNAGCCGDASGGHTIALVIAARGKQGYQSQTSYTHYSVLRTIEEAWQLGLMGGANDPGTQSMTDFFP